MPFAAPLAYLNISILKQQGIKDLDLIGGQALPVWANI